MRLRHHKCSKCGSLKFYNQSAGSTYDGGIAAKHYCSTSLGYCHSNLYQNNVNYFNIGYGARSYRKNYIYAISDCFHSQRRIICKECNHVKRFVDNKSYIAENSKVNYGRY